MELSSTNSIVLTHFGDSFWVILTQWGSKLFDIDGNSSLATSLYYFGTSFAAEQVSQ